MTAAVIARSVRILRQSSLLAEQYAWEAHLQGRYVLSARYDREANRLWDRSEELARAEATEAAPC